MKARKYWIAAVCALCIGMTGCGDVKSKTQAGREQADSAESRSEDSQAAGSDSMDAAQSSSAETQPANETQPVIPDEPAHYDALQDGEYVQVNDYIQGEYNLLAIDERLAKGGKRKPIGISISGSQFQTTISGTQIEGIKKYSGTVTQSGEQLSFDYQNLQWDCSYVPTHTRELLSQRYGSPVINVSVTENYTENTDICYMQKNIMQQWNKTGTFCLYSVPSLYPSISYFRNTPLDNVYPLYCDSFLLDVYRIEKTAVILKVKRDCLCVDTYGFTVKDQYAKGGAFSLNYNYKEAMEDNPNSRLYQNDGTINDWVIPRMRDKLEDTGSDYNTTIDFANGEWTWKNASGNLINNGVYSESEKYPGLIEMKLSEQSKVDNTSYMMYSAIFYIADDGKIYYPSFIKAE